jgi:hypothetical protein
VNFFILSSQFPFRFGLFWPVFLVAASGVGHSTIAFCNKSGASAVHPSGLTPGIRMPLLRHELSFGVKEHFLFRPVHFVQLQDSLFQ